MRTIRRTPWARALRLGLLAGLLLGPTVAEVHADPVRTRFDPAAHGFAFRNEFKNELVPNLDIRTGGLCGGMVYAALDCFNRGRPIPRQDYRPANGTVLESYIYRRQATSITQNLDKWGEVGLNPGGARNAEFFRWGVQGTRGGRLQELRAAIDSGRPVPLGLQEFGGSVGDVKLPGNHQVLAIGYDMGRYGGDLGAHVEDLRIFVYDPNQPNATMTLVPDPATSSFYYRGPDPALRHDGQWVKRWRTYFVDRKYVPAEPPTIRPLPSLGGGWIDELVVQVDTGDDDLRGGNDNVGLAVTLTDGNRMALPNINVGARWLGGYTEFARVVLPRRVHKDTIASLTLETTFGGGVGGDNWDTKRIAVSYYDGGVRRMLVDHRTFFRFTGDHRRLVLTPPRAASPTPAPGGADLATHLKVAIRTGGDDLRGNNDNVDVAVLFRDGSRQTFPAVNTRQRWADNTDHTVELRFPRPVPRSEIVGLMLTTTFRGGMGGDNWNVNGLTVTPMAESRELARFYERTGNPLFRFTGDHRVFTARW